MKQYKKQAGITVFLSYAQTDQPVYDQLLAHLSQLKRDGSIQAWSHQQILAGSDRSQEMDQAINSANIILLLISADFLASDTCYQAEMQQALQRHQQGEARVIPFLIRPCDWQHSPFAHLQCLPRNTKPLTTWMNQDEAFVAVIRELRKIIKQMQEVDLPVESSSSLVDRRKPNDNDQTLLYAGIFEQSNAPTRVARYGLTTEQFQQVFDLLKTHDFRLVDLSAWGVNDQLLQAGIFEESRGLLWKAHTRSTERFQEIFDQLVDQGYRLVRASGCALNGELFHSGIFEQRSDLPWMAHFDLTGERFQEIFDQLVDQGYRLRDVSGYAVSGQTFYAAIFEQGSGPPWVVRYGLTNGQFQQAFGQLTDQGYRLVNRSDWGVNGQALHAGIFEQRDDPSWCSYSNLTPKRFQQIFEELTAKGYQPLRISGYGV